MVEPFFNEYIHVPARLSLLALLAPVQWMEFRIVRESLDTSDSALSKQISSLQDAGYVEVSKDRLHGRRSTRVRLSEQGRVAFGAHAAALEQIVAAAHQRPQSRPTTPQEGAFVSHKEQRL
ncbi:transcriptional regulator [Spirillospora sp. NPDC052269]